MAETFPLPRSSFKLLRLILIGYLHEGGNARKGTGPTAVGATVGLDPTLVSRNNAFLAAIGLLEPAENRRWRLTDAGVDVARALEYEAMDEFRESLHGVLSTNDFVQRVIAFVRGRGGVDEDQLASQVARLAGVRRASEFMTGARALIELVGLAGLLARDGEMLRVPSGRERPVAGTLGRGTAGSAPSTPTELVERHVGTVDMPSGTVVSLNIALTSSDLKSDAAVDALVARIRRLLDQLSAD